MRSIAPNAPCVPPTRLLLLQQTVGIVKISLLPCDLRDTQAQRLHVRVLASPARQRCAWHCPDSVV
jgi:hypothetical protein